MLNTDIYVHNVRICNALLIKRVPSEWLERHLYFMNLFNNLCYIIISIINGVANCWSFNFYYRSVVIDYNFKSIRINDEK